MPDITNPYIPGHPVDNPSLFFGRRETVSALREGLLKGRRVFLVAGAERLGKTSLLRQLPGFLSEEFVAARFELRDEEPEQLDGLLWRLAVTISRQAGRPLGLALPEPAWADFEANTGRLLEDYWPQARAALGDRCLVLLLDDLDSLIGHQSGLLEKLVAILVDWRERDENLAVVCTASVAGQETLLREHPRLFGGAQAHTLGPLNSEEANRLVTWPVDGVLTYDYGVARRLIEITSGQPYYLHLLCFEVFNRCAPSGWVNQRDLDLVVEDLVGREIADFRLVWEESSRQEQAVLAALVSLRGARGVATVREVRTILVKAGARVEPEQVAAALDQLAARGILQRLGALSYRFRVGLLRDWLAERIDLVQVVRDTRWNVAGRAKLAPKQEVSRLRPRPKRRAPPSRRPPPPPPAESARPPEAEAEAEKPTARPIPWLWIVAGVLAVVVIALAAALLLRPVPVEPGPAATLPASPTARLAAATVTLAPVQTGQPSAPALASATATETPGPTLTPSPTPPLVVARAVPAIAYQARSPEDDRWSVYVMSSDGAERTRLAAGQSGFLSAPSWSPDGGRIAFASDMEGDNADVWVIGLDGGNLTNLTNQKAKDHSPAWSPDGQWIAFASLRDSLYWELYLMRADGSDVRRLTWWEDASDLSPSWSPDGTRLAFASKRDGDWEIYTMDRDGGNLVRMTRHPADDTNPAWSPDGGRIAFVSTRDGYPEIYVLALAGGEPVNMSNAPFSSEHGPTWSPDGGRLAFYSDRDGEWDVWVMASDGSGPVKLTGDNTNDQVPAWRP